jgi:hypothetical protein
MNPDNKPPQTRYPQPRSSKQQDQRLLTVESVQFLTDASPEAEERLTIAVLATTDATCAAGRSLEELSDKLRDDLLLQAEKDALPENRGKGNMALVQLFFRYFVDVEHLTAVMLKSVESPSRMLRIFPEKWLTDNNRDFCRQCQAAGREPSLLDKLTGKCPKCGRSEPA